MQGASSNKHSIVDYSEFVTFSDSLSLCGPYCDGLVSLSTPEIISQEVPLKRICCVELPCILLVTSYNWNGTFPAPTLWLLQLLSWWWSMIVESVVAFEMSAWVAAKVDRLRINETDCSPPSLQSSRDNKAIVLLLPPSTDVSLSYYGHCK